MSLSHKLTTVLLSLCLLIMTVCGCASGARNPQSEAPNAEEKATAQLRETLRAMSDDGKYDFHSIDQAIAGGIAFAEENSADASRETFEGWMLDVLVKEMSDGSDAAYAGAEML